MLPRRQCKASGEKLVLFSMSLPFLNSVEQLLKADFGLKLCEGYFRIDGAVDAKPRINAINGFNSGVGFKVGAALSGSGRAQGTNTSQVL